MTWIKKQLLSKENFENPSETLKDYSRHHFIIFLNWLIRIKWGDLTLLHRIVYKE